VQFFQRQEIKDVLSYLRLAANPSDEVAFERAVAVPRRGVGKVSVAKLVAHAREHGLDLVTAAAEARRVGGVTPRAAGELERFGELILGIAELDEETPADEVLTRVLEESGMLEALDGAGADGVTRRENLDELVAGARHHAARSETPGFRAYVEEVALRTDLDGWDPEEDTLTLMTAHNAKGLEFDVVFVAGLEEGLLPHSSSMDDPDGLEEERRLFYVALTRARQRCYLSAGRDRRRMNRYESARPSRFVDEIPSEHLERRDPWGLGLSSGRYSGGTTARRMRAGSVPGGGAEHAVAYEDPVFEVGAERAATALVGRLVRHAKFGRGVVLSQEGTGENAKCEVRFMGETHKKIVARFLDVEDEYDA
jgi:DNA helicase-2/ATP-dependent DNA helicase PcrA